jgi:hypothetical protein
MHKTIMQLTKKFVLHWPKKEVGYPEYMYAKLERREEVLGLYGQTTNNLTSLDIFFSRN